MEFNDILEELGVLKKFYTASDKDGRTVFYKGSDQHDGKLRITNYNNSVDEFDLNLINLLSVNEWDGLLIHYDSLDGRKLYPYRLMNINELKIMIK